MMQFRWQLQTRTNRHHHILSGIGISIVTGIAVSCVTQKSFMMMMMMMIVSTIPTTTSIMIPVQECRERYRIYGKGASSL